MRLFRDRASRCTDPRHPGARRPCALRAHCAGRFSAPGLLPGPPGAALLPRLPCPLAFPLLVLVRAAAVDVSHVRGCRGCSGRGAVLVPRAEGGTLFERIAGTLRLPDLAGTIRFMTGTQSVGVGNRSGGQGSTVFVAGATGKLGSRIVVELLNQGFRVRAGVRDVQEAEVRRGQRSSPQPRCMGLGRGSRGSFAPGTQGFINQAIELGIMTQAQMRSLELIRFDLTDPSTFARARGGCERIVFAAAYSGPVSKPGGYTDVRPRSGWHRCNALSLACRLT